MASSMEPRRGARRSSLGQPGQMSTPFESFFRDFEDFFTQGRSLLSPYAGGAGEASMPLSFDTRETNESYIMAIDLPGVAKEDIEVDIAGDTLTIRGERRNEYQKTEGRSLYSERLYGSFERHFSLPNDCDPSLIEATYEQGVLHLMIPKAAETKRHKIAVKEGGGFIDKVKKAVGIDQGQAKADDTRQDKGHGKAS